MKTNLLCAPKPNQGDGMRVVIKTTGNRIVDVVAFNGTSMFTNYLKRQMLVFNQCTFYEKVRKCSFLFEFSAY